MGLRAISNTIVFETRVWDSLNRDARCDKGTQCEDVVKRILMEGDFTCINVILE